jgi:hypothetical protein
MNNGAGAFIRVVITIMMAAGTTLGSDLNISSFSAYSGQTTILLQVNGNITFSGGSLSLPTLPPGSPTGQLMVQAGTNIVVNDGTTIDGTNWNVSFAASNSVILNQSSGISALSGAISIHAPSIDHDGTLQADSTQGINSLIELIASNSISLGANSSMIAQGDPTSAIPSPGGFVVLQSGNTYADTPTSTIDVTGQNGGQNGIVEIMGSGPVQSNIGANFALLENPYDLTISSSPTSSSSQNSENDYNFNTADLSPYSQIDLHALDDITLNTAWTLTNSTSASRLNLSADNDITLNDGSGLNAGNNWSVNLSAGSQSVASAPVSGSDGVYLDGSAYIQIQNGNINVWAANEVQIGYGDYMDQSGSGGIRTLNGGNIDVTAQYGDVNAGANPNGFNYQATASYCTVATDLGGISTAAGGNVTITAGGDVISYLPAGSTSAGTSDGGSGAFGPEAGNVTINAEGNVYGNYVLANGVGSITAGQNAGLAANPFALSLIDGSWSVSAPNGYINLQEVRNPNGDFNDASGRGTAPTPGKFLFNYAPDDAVDLTAYGVTLLGQDVPRLVNYDVPILYPPILDITAGAGGVTLDASANLFPSPDQNLNITITGGGDLTAAVDPVGGDYNLYMSDSSLTQWVPGTADFTVGEPVTTLPENLNNPNPDILNISGSMENLNLITSGATQLTVDGNMDNCGFSGQNLNASDVTSFAVGGEIYNQSAYTFATNVLIPNVPATDLLPGMGASWDNVFVLALNPSVIATLTAPSNFTPAQQLAYALQTASLFGVNDSTGQWIANGGDQGFILDPDGGQLGYAGPMSSSLLSDLSEQITVLKLANGEPVINSNGTFETDTVIWAPPSTIQALYTASQADPSPANAALGYRIGGPGEFNITAGQISLGNSYGILSCGVADTTGGFGRYGNLASVTPEGASLNVTVNAYGNTTADGNLNMLTSTIAALGGGSVNVFAAGSIDLGMEGLSNSPRQVGFGIFTAGAGNVSVTTYGNIDIDGSRIATYDGGNIFVESYNGNVDAGSGGDSLDGVYLTYVNPNTGLAGSYTEDVFGSGIVANTLVPGTAAAGYPPAGVGIASVPGNIIVETPEGNISTTEGGITQIALDGNVTAGPTITLVAGSPGYVGNIYVGESGVVGDTVNIMASGSIVGLNFSGTTPNTQSNITAVAGTNIEFSVNAYGSQPISYQWFENGSSLPGQTNDFLSLTNINRSDAALYSVITSNAAGVATNIFLLHVQVPELMNASLSPDGQTLQVSFSDADGGLPTEQDISSFVIETSPDLINWTVTSLPITTNASGGLSFEVPAITSSGNAYYRIISQ